MPSVIYLYLSSMHRDREMEDFEAIEKLQSIHSDIYRNSAQFETRVRESGEHALHASTNSRSIESPLCAQSREVSDLG